jgi:hypothetical protein
MAIIDKITGKPWTGPKPDDWLGIDKGTYAEYSEMLDKAGAAYKRRAVAEKFKLSLLFDKAYMGASEEEE